MYCSYYADKYGAIIIISGIARVNSEGFHDVIQTALSQPFMFLAGELDGSFTYFDQL